MCLLCIIKGQVEFRKLNILPGTSESYQKPSNHISHITSMERHDWMQTGANWLKVGVKDIYAQIVKT